MKKQIFKIISILLLSAFLLTIIGCSSKDKNGDDSGEAVTPQAYLADCTVNGRDFFFVDYAAKTEWKAPLTKLLSNILVPYGEHGEILGYEATIDSNAPTIPQCYRCGLLDVTMDGVPELLVHPFGYFGSSGTATYFVYNIYSGQKLGEIDSGNSQSLCFYYDTENERLDLIGQYWLRGGWPWRGRYITKFSYDEAIMECYCIEYLHTEHDIDGEKTDIVDEDPNDMFYTATWVETYPNTKYYVYSSEVYLDDYYAEYDKFVRNYIRIPETELVLFDWDEVSDEEDSYAVKGEKMAEALITSTQEFISPR